MPRRTQRQSPDRPAAATAEAGDQPTGRRSASRLAFAPALPETFAVRAASDTSWRADRAARRLRQASEGRPAVSAAAISEATEHG